MELNFYCHFIRTVKQCAPNPKSNLIPWARTYDVTFPCNSFVSCSMQKTQGYKTLLAFNFVGLLWYIRQ